MANKSVERPKEIWINETGSVHVKRNILIAVIGIAIARGVCLACADYFGSMQAILTSLVFLITLLIPFTYVRSFPFLKSLIIAFATAATSIVAQICFTRFIIANLITELSDKADSLGTGNTSSQFLFNNLIEAYFLDAGFALTTAILYMIYKSKKKNIENDKALHGQSKS